MTSEDGGRIPRRQFVRGLAAAAGVIATAGGGALVVRRHGPSAAERLGEQLAGLPLPSEGPGVLLSSAMFAGDDAIERSGGRRSAAPTAGYLDPAVPKASIVPDGEGQAPRVVLPGPSAGVVLPAAGLVPHDGWSASIDVRNVGDVDIAELAVDDALILLAIGGIVLWMLEPGEVSLSHLVTGQHVSWSLRPGAWPPGSSQRFTVRWRGQDAALLATLGSGEDAHRVADPPDRSVPTTGPPGGTDDGIVIGGSAAETQPFEFADLRLHRSFDAAPGDADAGPRLVIDADRAQGHWPPGLSGTLAVHAGFDLREGSTRPAVRDRQYELVYDEAGSRLVRVGGPMNLIDIELGRGDEDATGRRYGWDRLDAQLDALLLDRPQLRLHLTLDFTPEVLQPPGGDHRSPPTDLELWAAIAVDVVAHVADRYGDQFSSVTLWNEPDYDVYWTGTDDQLHALWEATQTALMEAGSPHLLGSPEYAFTPGIERFFAWLAGRPEPLRRSVQAVYVHDFQQDLRLVRQRVRTARGAARAATGRELPVRITEYNLALAQIAERRTDPDSWYRTQPSHFTSEYAAAYAVHLLWEVLDEADVDAAAFAAIGAQPLFWGQQALVTSRGEIRPYPALGAIAMLSSLGGTRVRADANWPGVRAFATQDDDGAITVVQANFRPYRGFIEDLTVAVDWRGLPGRFTWTRWQLDRDHLDDHRPAIVGEGDERDLPVELTMGALGVGAIRIVPT